MTESAELGAYDIGECAVTFLGRSFPMVGIGGEYIFDRLHQSHQPYEHELLEVLASLDLPDDGLIVDVGANLGNHTVALALAFPNPLLSVEPDPVNFALLGRNVTGNDLEARAELVHAGLWDHATTLRTEQNSDTNRGMIAVVEDPAGEITARTLDDVVGGRRVALVKIDVEGAEAHVARGGTEVLRRDHPFVVLEAHGPLEYRSQAAVLAPLGYQPVFVGGISDNYLWAHPETDGILDLDALRSTLQLAETRRTARASRRLMERVHRTVTATSQQQAADAAHMAELERTQGELQAARQRNDDLERRTAALEAAFRGVSRRFEQATPGAWSARQADAILQTLLHEEYRRSDPGTTLSAAIPQYRVRELNRPRESGSNPVRVGIASMPGREAGLEAVLRSLAPQADEIMVYLNGMTAIPENIPYFRNVKFFTGPDYGDRAKFLFLNGFTGYYLTCDDDIDYPPYYVAHVIDGIERYGRGVIVGWHGTLFNDDFTDYYDKTSRTTYTYFNSLAVDTPVHLLGTGAVGLHTSTMPIEFEDFRAPNTADIWLALRAQTLSVPMVALAHGRRWATPLDRDAPSIFNAASGPGGPVMNVRTIATAAVKGHGEWRVHEPAVTLPRDPIAVTIIGRTDPERWRKGGIFKSNIMIADALRAYGVDVHLVDIETGEPEGLGGHQPDAVIVYVGDPDRPDYQAVERIVELHASRGRLVIVNMSVQGRDERGELIRRKIGDWNARYPGAVQLMTFTDMARRLPGLDEIDDLLVSLPKTLTLPRTDVRFDDTAGIFLGDAAKLGDDFLVGGHLDDWITAIRTAVPEAKLYAVQQYKSRHGRTLDLDEVWPFSADTFFDRLATMRVMVAPVKYATYEMVPVEAAAMGIPVIYRDMPQSLSEVLGLAGLQVDNPADLDVVLPLLYRDAGVWHSYSRAGRLRAESQDMRAAAGQMYLHIRRALATRDRERASSGSAGREPGNPGRSLGRRAGFAGLGAAYEHAARAAGAPDGYEDFALHTQSLRMRDVLALRASRMQCDASELVRVATAVTAESTEDPAVAPTARPRSGTPSRWTTVVAAWESDGVASLARVIAYQRTSEQDVRDALTLYTLLRQVWGDDQLTKADRHLYLELLQEVGRFAESRQAIDDLDVRRSDVIQAVLMAANVDNPTYNSAATGWQAWFDGVNAFLSDYDYCRIGFVRDDGHPLDRLGAVDPLPTVDGPLVTVIVPTHKGAGTIRTALDSLARQTWRNLEIIVVDDASGEDEVRALERIVADYGQARLVRQTENRGSYSARNLALREAAGEFVTVHDDDDWSHPQKIQIQVEHLQGNPDEVANMSRQVRCTEDLVFLRMYRNPSFTMPNFSSLLVRRSAFDAVGGWHEVNRGADAEFKDRLVTHFGRPVPVLKGPPLSFMRMRATSLTGGEIGRGFVDPSRRLYTTSYQRFHHGFTESGQGSAYWQRLDIPHAVAMHPGPKSADLGSYEVLLAADFRGSDVELKRLFDDLTELSTLGRRVGVVPLESAAAIGTHHEVAEALFAAIRAGQVDVLGLRDRARARHLVVYGPHALQFLDTIDATLDVDDVVVLADVDAVPAGGAMLYDPRQVLDVARRLFGATPRVFVPGDVSLADITRERFGVAPGEARWEGAVRSLGFERTS